MILVLSLLLCGHSVSVALGEQQVLSGQLTQLAQLDQVLVSYPFQIGLLKLSISHILEESLNTVNVHLTNHPVHVHLLQLLPVKPASLLAKPKALDVGSLTIVFLSVGCYRRVVHSACKI